MNQFQRFSVTGFSFCGLYVNGMMDLFGYMERYGLSYIDLWNGMTPNLDDDYAKLVRENLDERGLTVANVCFD